MNTGKGRTGFNHPLAGAIAVLAVVALAVTLAITVTMALDPGAFVGLGKAVMGLFH